MVALIRHSLINLGGKTLVVSLPKVWVEYHGLRAKDRVEIVAENGELKIRPVPREVDQKASMLSSGQTAAMWRSAGR